jgi:hypothetical protein
MKTHIAEFPKHPFPQTPQPETPQPPRVQPPNVYVYERQQWEYQVVKKTGGEPDMPEDELNALGKHGWELAGVVPVQSGAHFVFKRVK